MSEEEFPKNGQNINFELGKKSENNKKKHNEHWVGYEAYTRWSIVQIEPESPFSAS